MTQNRKRTSKSSSRPSYRIGKLPQKEIITRLCTRYMSPENPGERQQIADFLFTKLRF